MNNFGTVYLLFDGTYFKIGKTKKLKNRLSQIKANNVSVDLIAFKDCYNYSELERILHNRYRKFRYKNEWFLVNDLEELINLWLSFSIYYRDFDDIASINFKSDINLVRRLKELIIEKSGI